MNSRERFLAILRNEPADRPAVVCPGGMMSMAVTEVMSACGAAWPEAHRDARSILRLALAMQEATGFDNLAMPFCMTVEAEAYGAEVDLGSVSVQPRVIRPILPGDGTGEFPAPDFRAGRAGTLLSALAMARDLRTELPLVGNLVGPFSLLGMLSDPLMVLRWTRRKPDVLLALCDRIVRDLIAFGRMQKEAGAEVLCIAEPTATGEILGGTLFRKFLLPSLQRMIGALKSEGLEVIVHICGDVAAIEGELFELGAGAVSFDSMVDIVRLVGKKPPWAVMGNVDAFLLRKGPSVAVRRCCRRLVEGGVRLLAPACGVIPSTPVTHLREMRNAAG
jgi:[methyl-Co(III) methanol-specific corrinoid protein]:coenzyme M methyltransferase